MIRSPLGERCEVMEETWMSCFRGSTRVRCRGAMKPACIANELLKKDGCDG